MWKGNARHCEKENATDSLIKSVRLATPCRLSMANGLYTTGMLDPSRFPCHQLNGSFNALSALRKTVQRANQEVFISV